MLDTKRLLILLIVSVLLYGCGEERSGISLQPQEFGVPLENCVSPSEINTSGTEKPTKLVHVSLGLSRFYIEYNKWFIEWWKCRTGQTIAIEQLLGASGDLMRSTIKKSVHPDVISMSNPSEMDERFCGF